MSKRKNSRGGATIHRETAHAPVLSTSMVPDSEAEPTEQEADAEYDQLMARMEEETERSFLELREAQEAACRKRWWVLGFRTEVF